MSTEYTRAQWQGRALQHQQQALVNLHELLLGLPNLSDYQSQLLGDAALELHRAEDYLKNLGFSVAKPRKPR